MSDETLIGRVADRVRRDRYDGPERREKPADWLKWLPLATAVVFGAMGYGSLQTKVQHLEATVAEIKAANQAQWERIGNLMGRD